MDPLESSIHTAYQQHDNKCPYVSADKWQSSLGALCYGAWFLRPPRGA